MEKLLDFSKALEYLKKGFKITRESWTEVDSYICLFKQGDYETIIYGVGDKTFECICQLCCCDVLAEDWMVCRDKKEVRK